MYKRKPHKLNAIRVERICNEVLLGLSHRIIRK